MNIDDLAKQAIERINSMSIEELEEKFIEHGYGYVPVRKERKITIEYTHKYSGSFYGGKLESSSAHIIKAANQPNFFSLKYCDMDIAA